MAIEVYPVVHINDNYQAVQQSENAFTAGADGVYLIAHQADSPNTVLDAYNDVRQEFPNQFIGLNLLQLATGYHALMLLDDAKNRGQIAVYPNGLWVDDASLKRDEFIEYRNNVPELKSIRYLGGVAFKYTTSFTEQPDFAAEQTAAMASYVDVITTSGAGTGVPPTVDKIAAMKRVAKEQRLAVASGIDESNIADFKGSIDMVLIASGIENRPYSGIFDTAKLRSFTVAAHTLN